MLVLNDEAKEYLIKKGSDLDFGARPLRRAIENYVEDPLAEELLRGEFQGKDTIAVTGFRNDKDKVVRLQFDGSVEKEPEPEEPTAAVAGSDSEGGDNPE